jgi:adenylate cyclase
MAVDTLLSRSFVVPSPRAIAPLLGVAFATAAALAGGLLSPLAGVVVAAVGLLLYWAAAGVAFGGQTRYWLPLATPSLGIAGGYLSGILARHWSEEREKRALAGALSRYLSPGVVRRVLSEPDGLRLGGKRKELSVLVAEVASFAEVAEGLEPEEVDEFLTAFFAAMSEVVFRHEGTLDQLTGQGVRAFFGDPEPQEDHALRAVRCALEMRGRSADVVRAWARRGRPPLQIGIGICSGYVTVGNVGSLRRMEYTVLGRNVELAAQLARAEPGRVLVSPRTRALTDTAVSYEARSRADGPPSSFEAIGSR